MKDFNSKLRDFERLQERNPGGPDEPDCRWDGDLSCMEENGENGDCPLGRKSCHGCRYD